MTWSQFRGLEGKVDMADYWCCKADFGKHEPECPNACPDCLGSGGEWIDRKDPRNSTYCMDNDEDEFVPCSRCHGFGRIWMPEKRTKVPLPNGQTADGLEVTIKETTERWSEVTLEDGATLRLKPNVLSVVRIDGQYDPEGNPLYVLKSNQVMMVANVPAHLRRGAITGKA